MIDLVNMKINMGHMMDERMGQLEKKTKENMGRITNLIHNLEEKFTKGEEWAQLREDKDSVCVEKPYLNKNITRGFDSNNGSI